MPHPAASGTASCLWGCGVVQIDGDIVAGEAVTDAMLTKRRK